MTYSPTTAIARFVNLRSPQSAAERGKRKVKTVTAPDGQQSRMAQAAATGDVKNRDEMRVLAKQVLQENPPGLAGLDLEDKVRGSVPSAGSTAGEAAGRIEVALGHAPADLVASEDYRRRLAATWDEYFARVVLGQDLRETANTLRAAAMLAEIAIATSGETVPGWSDALAWRPVVPKAIVLPAAPRTVERPPEVGAMLDKVKALHAEMVTLERIADKAAVEDQRYYKQGAGAQSNVSVLRDPKAGMVPKEVQAAVDASDGDVGTIGEVMEEPENWLRAEMANPQATSMFSEDEQALLKRHERLTMDMPEVDAVAAMRSELYRRTRDLLWDTTHAMPAEVLDQPETKALMMQMKLPKAQQQKKDKWKRPGTKNYPDLSRVHLLGVGDLIVVEQRVNRYEMGEIAHVENVMATETRRRVHVRTSEKETTVTTETEETTTDERSLQTTERFELSKETEKQLESSLGINAGASVSGSYGVVTVSANFGVETSRSSSSATSTASTIAREAVEKAVSSVTRRVREEQINRVLERIEETNHHEFMNGSEQKLSGIYRWIDKYYTVRAVNYGRRLMLEMVVPEPGTALTYAREMHEAEDAMPPPPPPIDFSPSEIDRDNYRDHVATYAATDVPEPPPNRIYKTLTYGAVSDGGNKHFVETGKTIAIPPGYKTANVWKHSWLSYQGDWSSHHLAGSKSVPGDDSELAGVTEELQVSSKMQCVAFHVGWKVRCELMTVAFRAWQVAVWSSLKAAYDAALAAHEERVAARAIGHGVQIHGLNPGQHEEIIRNELKRAAIKYLSEDMAEISVRGAVQSHVVFNASDATGDFHLNEARLEGMIIQFFEQAFEWRNMTWLLYPYYWADSSRQHKKLLAEDHDPMMREFLSAGAARVVVPVPIEYEDAVLSFFETNEIWNGGEPPMIDDPTYVSIAEELKASRTNSFDAPIYYEGAGTPPPFIVDEWEVKLPTSLVLLQEGADLPKFPAGLYESDAAALLDAKVQSSGGGAGWRNSVVDLLTLYGVDEASDESVRRDFASEKEYPNDAAVDSIASVDTWTYFFVMRDIGLNGLSGPA